MTNYEEVDLTLAIQLQAQFEEELRTRLKQENEDFIKKLPENNYNGNVPKYRNKNQNFSEHEQDTLSVSLIDPSWELLDPNPNILDLFLTFNDQFFWGRLAGIEVKWSPRMTLCAGVCSYQGRGGLCSVRLSLPLLKLRPRKDLIETLLHELIHAYLFVTANNTDRDGHGEQFHKHMYRINRIAGTKITVYHSFHDEVNVYKQHIWQCNGPCRTRRPFFGLVKRSMNRAPGPNDTWYAQHQQTCGGSYTKIKEPEGYGVKKKKVEAAGTKKSNPRTDIRKFFSPTKENRKVSGGPTSKPSGLGSLSVNGGIGVSQQGNKPNSNIFGFNNNGNKNPSKKGNAKPVRNSGSKGGSGLATKFASDGSTTTTIKKKTEGKDQTPQEVEKIPSPEKFGGTGQTLGSASGSGRSRLLDLYSSNSGSVNKPNKTGSSTMDLIELESNSPEPDKCPLCSRQLKPGSFDQHISECIGDDFDDDNFVDLTQSVATTSLSSSSDIYYSRSRGLFRSSSPPVSVIDSSAGRQSSPIVIDDSPNETLYSCPVCNRQFAADRIHVHVGEHFD